MLPGYNTQNLPDYTTIRIKAIYVKQIHISNFSAETLSGKVEVAQA